MKLNMQLLLERSYLFLNHNSFASVFSFPLKLMEKHRHVFSLCDPLSLMEREISHPASAKKHGRKVYN
jgi:hypothetical protein